MGGVWRTPPGTLSVERPDDASEKITERQEQKLLAANKYFLDKNYRAAKIARMDEPFFRFWDRPLDWVADQCKSLGVELNDLVYREAKVNPGLWRKWVNGACEPTFRCFKPIVYAIERRWIEKAEAEKKFRRAASRRAAR